MVGSPTGFLPSADAERRCGGFWWIDWSHSLQAATLAYRDRMDEEYVVLRPAAMTWATFSHQPIMPSLPPRVKPSSPTRNWWLLQHHGIFQGYYFFHYLGLDRNMREQFRGHPNFERTGIVLRAA